MLISAPLRGFQLGLEDVQGTAVAANTQFENATMGKPKRRNNMKDVTTEQHKSVVAQQKGKRWSEWNIKGQIGYNIMPYWTSMIYGIDAVTPVEISADAAYQYAATMSSMVVDTPQTVTLEYGSNQGYNSKIAFATADTLSFTISETACDYTISGFGAYPTKGITLTASPTMISANVTHFLDYRVSYATSFGGIGAGKLLTAKEVQINVKNKYGNAFFIDDATQSYGGILEKKPDISGDITVAEGTESNTFLAQLEAGSKGYLQIKATGPLLASGSPNKYCLLTYTACIAINDDEESANNDLEVGKYTFNIAEDTTNGDVSLSTICGLTSLSPG